MRSLIQSINKKMDIARRDGLKARAMRGAFWTMLGYGSQQAIRLGSNLIMTRLLVPEMFGVMAIAQVFLVGLNMFSDLGINSSIVQNKRGEDHHFLNTAWTIQAIRGLCIYLVLVLIAYPVSLLYEQPILFPILCVLGINSIVMGFQTTGFASADKNLAIGVKTSIEVAAQLTGVLVMITWAAFIPSIWALVGGSVVGSMVLVGLGHWLLSTHKHQFIMVREHLDEIIRFGKWIFLSSVVGFFANQLDKLILGKLLTMEMLGFYTIAYTLSQLPALVSSQLGNRVMLPVYAKLQDIDRKEFRGYVFKVRTRVAGVLLPISVIFMVFGQQIVNFLYDDRYRSAGWMTEVLSAGVAVHLATNAGPFLLAMGKSKIFSIMVILKTVILALSMYAGWLYHSADGLIYGIAFSSLLFYVAQSVIYQRNGMWLWRLDAVLLSVVGGMFFLANLL
jgi:O-antigen/teichoic acid export membrane protein